jgi:hypothetical protein
MFEKFKKLQLVVFDLGCIFIKCQKWKETFLLNCRQLPKKQGMLVSSTAGDGGFIVITLLEIYCA